MKETHWQVVFLHQCTSRYLRDLYTVYCALFDSDLQPITLYEKVEVREQKEETGYHSVTSVHRTCFLSNQVKSS